MKNMCEMKVQIRAFLIASTVLALFFYLLMAKHNTTDRKQAYYQPISKYPDTTDLQQNYYRSIVNYLKAVDLKLTYIQPIANYLHDAYLKENNTRFGENVEANKTSKQLLLTVGVLSRLSAIDRRMAIRTTWFHVCKDNVDKIVCKFFTDSPQKDQAYYDDEQTDYNDVEYMPFQG